MELSDINHITCVMCTELLLLCKPDGMNILYMILLCLCMRTILSLHCSQATIRVCISDINDNCPVIAVDASAVSYPENENPSAPEIVVKTITVTDGDSNPNAELSFTLENPGGVTTDAFPFYLTNTGPATGSLVSTG